MAAWVFGFYPDPGGSLLFVGTPVPLVAMVVIAAIALAVFDPRLAAGVSVYLVLQLIWASLTWSMNREIFSFGSIVWSFALTLTAAVALVTASRLGRHRVDQF